MDSTGISPSGLLSILEVTRRLAEQRQVYPLMEYVLATVFELIAAERCLIVLVDADGALDVRLARTREGDPIESAHTQMSASIVRQACAAMSPLLVNDALSESPFREAKSVQSLSIRSVICVPLILHERSIGAIYVENRSARAAFRHEQLLPLVLFSHQVVTAIENARLNEALSRSNADIKRALQLKDEFLMMISHELRTPLGTILGLGEALSNDLYGPLSSEQQAALEMICTSGQRLLGVIANILDLARIVAGKETLDWQQVELEITCMMVIESISSAAGAKAISVQHSSPQTSVKVWGDDRRITQILSILLDNAVKFTPAGGTVGLDVRTDATQECVRLCVWDTGIGIAEEHRDRLFQPFTQVEGWLTRSYEGAGLGLSLAYRLVDLHEGSISLESAPGLGSRFTVSLPWSVEEPVLDKVGAKPANWLALSHLAIADGHDQVLRSYTHLLLRQGYQVSALRTLAELLSVVRTDRPALLLLDLQLIGLDGIAALRAERALAAVPIIVLSALELPGDRERCRASGADVFLSRPVSPRALQAVVASILGGRDETQG
jgi:signal transduction histidine kinase/CheY-like chemotaxis protein